MTGDRSRAFSPMVMLVLVLVGCVSLAGLGLLAAYEPELRSGDNGQGHALSRSAVGFAAKVSSTPSALSSEPWMRSKTVKYIACWASSSANVITGPTAGTMRVRSFATSSKRSKPFSIPTVQPPVHQSIDDELVEARGHDCKARALGHDELTFEDGGQGFVAHGGAQHINRAPPASALRSTSITEPAKCGGPPRATQRFIESSGTLSTTCSP